MPSRRSSARAAHALSSVSIASQVCPVRFSSESSPSCISSSQTPSVTSNAAISSRARSRRSNRFVGAMPIWSSASLHETMMWGSRDAPCLSSEHGGRMVPKTTITSPARR